MMLPLSNDAQLGFETQKTQALGKGHKGLLFERFYDGYNNDFRSPKDDDDAKRAKTRLLSLLAGKCGDTNEITRTIDRRIELVNSLNGTVGIFKTDWYFITGMGLPHPAKNGFNWHPVLGTPYIPGSGVKGLLRAWMEAYASDPETGSATTPDLISEWFGGSAKPSGVNDTSKAGDLVFFDALPVERPFITVDIMTPHMGKWYEQGQEPFNQDNTPGDWHNPIPVPFLATRDARFMFAIAPRCPEAQASAKAAMEQLKHALAWLGAGAKTAAGYGYMSFDAHATETRLQQAIETAKEQRRQKLIENMSEEEQVIEALKARIERGEGKNKGASCVLADDLRKACESATDWNLHLRTHLHALAIKACKLMNIKIRDKWKKRLQDLLPEND